MPSVKINGGTIDLINDLPNAEIFMVSIGQPCCFLNGTIQPGPQPPQAGAGAGAAQPGGQPAMPIVGWANRDGVFDPACCTFGMWNGANWITIPQGAHQVQIGINSGAQAVPAPPGITCELQDGSGNTLWSI